VLERASGDHGRTRGDAVVGDDEAAASDTEKVAVVPLNLKQKTPSERRGRLLLRGEKRQGVE
jgi:hypothetical protein